MSETPTDPRCPECGEPIGQTATYCMHCSADLSDEKAAANDNDNSTWDQAEAIAGNLQESAIGSGSSPDTPTARRRDRAGTATRTGRTRDEASGQLLDPDGIVDNTLTVLVGIGGGIVVGLVGTIVLGIVTQSAWAILFGFVTWLGATAYLVRRRTVQGAVAKSGYAIAAVLLLIPFIAVSPLVSVEGGISGRVELFVVLLFFVAIPAGISAALGWLASRFVPDDRRRSEG